MHRILWLGNPYFSKHLKSLGWELHLHVCRKPATFVWDDLVALCGAPPDVVVLGDNSLPPMLLGLEHYPCLTVFFSVDSHIHSWHPQYAQAFDLCCLNLKDNLPAFAQRLRGERLRWLPLYADATPAPPAVPEAEKEYDLLFVGNVRPEVHPGRHAFFERFAPLCPGLTVTRGNFHQLFPKARIVFNFAERGDLNFRVFQALGDGCCLLTPRVGHGMLELFREDEELFCFDPEDVPGLLATVDRLLAAPHLREEAAAKGLAAVDAGHRATHRAETFTRWLHSQDQGRLVQERLQQAQAIHGSYLRLLYLHFAAGLPEHLKATFLEHARPAES